MRRPSFLTRIGQRIENAFGVQQPVLVLSYGTSKEDPDWDSVNFFARVISNELSPMGLFADTFGGPLESAGGDENNFGIVVGTHGLMSRKAYGTLLLSAVTHIDSPEGEKSLKEFASTYYPAIRPAVFDRMIGYFKSGMAAHIAFPR